MRWRTPLLATIAGSLLVASACASGDNSAGPVSLAADAHAADASPPVPNPAGAALRSPATPTPTPIPRPPSRGVPPPTIEAAAYLVVDGDTGASLLESNANARLAPASLTKIATAIVVLERNPDLETIIEVHPDLEKLLLEDSSTMKLLPGDRFSLRELLYGLLLVSGNDAAIELANALYGGEDAFVREMNRLAMRLNLRDTHFTDVHGLGGPGHYTTAHDLAVLSAHAMTFPIFREIVGTETHTTTGTQEIFLYNFNPLLNYTPGVDGIKTGYTEEAGPTFVVSATRQGHRVYVIVLNAKAYPFDAIALLEWAYADTAWP